MLGSVPIGFAIREFNRHILANKLVTAVEITHERGSNPLLLSRYLGDLNPQVVSVHALKLSPASPTPPPQSYLDEVIRLADENDASSISDHLGFTRDGDVDLGHFAPPPFCQSALDAVCRNVEFIQTRLGDRPLFLENIAYLAPLCRQMPETEFIRGLLNRTGCGLLLDVTNVYANALNHHFDAAEFIAAVTEAAPRLQIHLAGGFIDPVTGLYIDSHSEVVPQEVWDLFRFAMGIAGDRVEAVFIERDMNPPRSDEEWLDEVRTARRITASLENLDVH